MRHILTRSFKEQERDTIYNYIFITCSLIRLSLSLSLAKFIFNTFGGRSYSRARLYLYAQGVENRIYYANSALLTAPSRLPSTLYIV